MGDEVRAAALRLISGVTGAGQALNDQIGQGALNGLDPASRARAQRLALTVLRHAAPLDRVLAPFVRREPPPGIRAILRLAAAELLIEGEAAHGVVNAAVTLAKAGGRKSEGFAGLVNAVLRRVADLSPDVLAGKDPQALPGWLRGRLQSAYGKAAVIAMERAHARGAPLDLTARGSAGDLAAAVGADLLPTGSLRLTGQPQVSGLPGYAEGAFWVQDAAAALAATTLRVAPGERVLDLCAAPGGKTLQLAAAGAEVTALDRAANRMARVEENLKRCGLSARIVVADALTWEPEAPFDAVLLDAPCSATGTIRRHPDLPFVKDGSGLKEIVALQARLLDRALSFLRPGGRLVYATCSLLPEEGERQIAALLARRGDVTVDRDAVLRPGIDPAWVTADGGLRLRPDYWPDIGGMDGFFIAALRVGSSDDQ